MTQLRLNQSKTKFVWIGNKILVFHWQKMSENCINFLTEARFYVWYFKRTRTN